MAERRMFAKTIVDSDAFTLLPLSAQALYFHLGMKADDEGFVNAARRIAKSINASDKDLQLLIDKAFVLSFPESGVIVIKHWRINNQIRKDRFHETVYTEERNQLSIKENGAYTSHIWQPTDNQVETKEEKKETRHKYGRYNNVLLSDEDHEKLKHEFPGDYKERIERLSEYMASTGKSYKSHLATIRNWARKDGVKNDNKFAKYAK